MLDRAPPLRGELARDVADAGEGVRRLERRDDPLAPRDELDRRERLVVGRRQVRRAPALLEPGVLRADARVVEARADGVGLL